MPSVFVNFREVLKSIVMLRDIFFNIAKHFILKKIEGSLRSKYFNLGGATFSSLPGIQKWKKHLRQLTCFALLRLIYFAINKKRQSNIILAFRANFSPISGKESKKCLILSLRCFSAFDLDFFRWAEDGRRKICEANVRRTLLEAVLNVWVW